MWFGAFPGAFGLGRSQPQRRGTSPCLFRLERGPGIALQAMQEKKALSSRGRGRLSGFLVVMDREAYRAAIHGVTKSRTLLSDFPFTFHFHALEKEMAAHSGVLGTGLPGLGTEHLPGALCSGTGSPALGLCSP